MWWADNVLGKLVVDVIGGGVVLRVVTALIFLYEYIYIYIDINII